MDNPKSVLVIDDEEDFLNVIGRILTRKGYDVATSATAGDALARVGERHFDVAIVDISLPEMDGTELLPRILEIRPDIVAIMLTGYSSVNNAVRSFDSGAFAYLEKPLDPEHLFSVIANGFEKQRLKQENNVLVHELEERNRRNGILLDFSQAVSKFLDREEIVTLALDNLTALTGAAAACIYLRHNDTLALAGHCGFTGAAAARLAAPDIMALAGAACRRGQPGFTDVSTADHPLAVLAADGHRSYASVPLNLVGDTFGMLGIAAPDDALFVSRMDLFTGIGKEIAIAIQNANLYEKASSVRSLRELDTMRKEFLANVSHELRTPLAVIKGYASSLLQPDVSFDEQTWRDFLSSIDRDADRLNRLVDDLLLMSRLETGALTVYRQPHPPARLIHGVRDRLDNLAARHRLVVDVPETLPSVLADEDRIGEVLTNLVDNAVKYSAEGTCISLAVENTNGSDVAFHVADEGIGIPPEHCDDVFRRFFQVDAHSIGRRKGAGLGLPICRGIVEAHGGRIWVTGNDGPGVTVTFTIPSS